jgi:hypothetical protein
MPVLDFDSAEDVVIPESLKVVIDDVYEKYEAKRKAIKDANALRARIRTSLDVLRAASPEFGPVIDDMDLDDAPVPHHVSKVDLFKTLQEYIDDLGQYADELCSSEAFPGPEAFDEHVDPVSLDDAYGFTILRSTV